MSRESTRVCSVSEVWSRLSACRNVLHLPKDMLSSTFAFEYAVSTIYIL